MNRQDAEEFLYLNRTGIQVQFKTAALGIRLGVPKALGLTRKKYIEELGGAVRLDTDDRQEAVKELTAEGHSNRAIADILGVDETTVRRDSAANDAPVFDNSAAAAGLEDDGAANAAPDKASRRAQREAELAAKQKALPTKQYGVIYADPPWRFEPYSRETGMDRAADNHYPTMTLEQIKALPVPAAEDCVLFLWATGPMLPEALEVMKAWGFTYKSRCVWFKPKMGTGYWFRDQAEELLVGVRGNIPAPSQGEQYPSVITARAGEHSAKPFAFREMIEEMFPNLPRIELFARDQFKGWDAWGNEAEDH